MRPDCTNGWLSIGCALCTVVLRTIEANLQNSAMVLDIVVLEDELEETVAFGVPMRHSALYFSIKSHLHLVHNRIRKRRAELSAPLRSVQPCAGAVLAIRAGDAKKANGGEMVYQPQSNATEA
jgi:hypothetical protein